MHRGVDVAPVPSNGLSRILTLTELPARHSGLTSHIMETGSEPNLNESIASARHLLQLLSDNESTQVVLDFLANVPKIPLWLQEEGTGWGVLHFAALREDPSLVKAFIDAGAVWNLGNSFCLWRKIFLPS